MQTSPVVWGSYGSDGAELGVGMVVVLNKEKAGRVGSAGRNQNVVVGGRRGSGSREKELHRRWQAERRGLLAVGDGRWREALWWHEQNETVGTEW